MNVLVRWVVIGVLVLLVVVWGWRSFVPEPKGLREAVKTGEVDPAVDYPETDGTRMRRASASAAWRRYLAQSVEARNNLDAALAEARRWKGEIEPLLTNQEGRLLSADPTFISSFREDWNRRRPDLEQVAKSRAAVEELMRVATTGLSAKEISWPTPAMETQLQQFIEESRTTRDGYREGRERIQALLSEARFRQVTGTVLLQQALDEMTRRDAVEMAAVRDDQRKSDEKKKREEEIRRIELRERAGREALTEKERTRQAQMTDLHELYAPFLAEGHRNAFGDSCFVCQLSYGQLQKKGALDSPESFLEFAKNSGLHGRPTWGESERPMAAQRLATFKFLAPAWIRMGLLRP